MHRRRHVCAAILACAILVLSPLAQHAADASLIVVPNASFETPDVGDDVFTTTEEDPDAVPGWQFGFIPNGVISAGVWDPTEIDYTGSGGDNAPLPGTASGGQTGFVFLEQIDDLDPQFLVAELISAAPLTTIEQNSLYTLTVALGRSKSFDTGDVTVALISEKGTQLASRFIPAGTLVADTFTDVVVSYATIVGDSNAGKPLLIQITHTSAEPGSREVDIDNVRLDVVPEPGSAALALLALGTLAARRRRG